MISIPIGMKRLFIIALLALFAQATEAGESGLTTTYQPLDGLSSGEIVIASVTCHDWHAQSSTATAIRLISVVNIPPTNNPKAAKENLNLASLCGVEFHTSDTGDPTAVPKLTLDATKFTLPKTSGHSQEEIIRACLECLRRCLPDKLRETPVTLKSSGENQIWIGGILREFNSHDRSKAFYIPPQ